MATNKNQHFVPRCHLKPFTTEAAGISIRLFNLDRKKLIINAPVKNQCSRDYFYGSNDQLEAVIQAVESSYGQALRNIMQNSRILDESDKTSLKIFWLFQHLRTEAVAARTVQMVDDATAMIDLPKEEFSLGIKEAVRIACKTFVTAIHEIDDLKFCIVRNKSSVPFITSDNPAVLTSKWHLGKGEHDFGIGSAGVLTIMPLTPKLLFLGYDGDVYSVPNERGVVEIKNARDAIAFNQHQFLQCAANVYPGSVVGEGSLIDQYISIESRRPKERHKIVYAQLDRIDGGVKQYKQIRPEERKALTEAIMHYQVLHPSPLIWPSQIRIRPSGAVYTNGTGLGYIRAARSVGVFDGVFRRERP